MSTTGLTSIRRVLFLHGMFCPPGGYEHDLMPELLQQLTDRGCHITFVESDRETKSTLPPIFPFEELMPSQVRRKEHLPEWYNARDIDDGSGNKILDGLPSAINQLRTFLTAQDEPFDVIIGHSQGAQLVAILTLMMEADKDWLQKSKHWKAIVCLNSPNPFENEVTLADCVQQHGKIMKTPSLHIFGGDKDSAFSGSKAMRKTHFGGSNVWEVTHDEGHFPPRDAKVCEEIVDIIDIMMKQRL